eukprot:570034-Pyramimonas_sp.AAC.1
MQDTSYDRAQHLRQLEKGCRRLKHVAIEITYLLDSTWTSVFSIIEVRDKKRNAQTAVPL